MLLHGLSDAWPMGTWVAAQVLFWSVLAWSVIKLDLTHLKDFKDTSAWAATTLFFTLLWRLNAGIEPGLNFHIFGSALLTLLFGFHYMLIGGVLGMIGNALSGSGTIIDIPMSALAVLVIPGAVTHLIWRLTLYRLPPNFFVYIWGVGFFGASVAVCVSGTAVTTVLWVSGLYDLDYLTSFYFPYSLMQAFPEGFITGTVLSLLVVYQPQWVATFRDEFYLNHEKPSDAHRIRQKKSSDE